MTVEDMKNKFFIRVRELRSREKLSLTELARRSGLPLEMLEALENGILPEEMMVDDAINLARAFHCKVHELFE